MTSLEISSLTGKRHDNVLRDIRAMVKAFKKQESVPSDLRALKWYCEPVNYADAQGKEKPMFRLDKTTTITLLSGYDVVARHKIVTRWEQLESQQAAVTAEAQQLLVFTDRKKQIANSKEVNSFNYGQGGRDRVIDYNRKNCFYHTGKLPHELVEWAKKKNLPAKLRTSAKEVIRNYRPAVSSSMALTDDFYKTGKVAVEEAASFCKSHALPLFEKMQEFGLIAPPEPTKRLA
jgi:phage regulator Rha-like protein